MAGLPVVVPAPKRPMTVSVEVLAPEQWSPDDVREAFEAFRPWGITVKAVNVSAPAPEDK